MRQVGITHDRHITRFSVVGGHDGTPSLIQANLIMPWRVMRQVGISSDRHITRFSVVGGHDGTPSLIQADLIMP